MQQIDCCKQFRKCGSASPITNINVANICFTFIDTNISVMITIVNWISQRTTSRHWMKTITTKSDSIIISYYLHFINKLCARFFAGIRDVALLLNRQQVFWWYMDDLIVIKLLTCIHHKRTKELNGIRYNWLCIEETWEHVSCRVIISFERIASCARTQFRSRVS